MTLSKRLLYVFIFFYVIVSAYLLCFFVFPEFQDFVISVRSSFVILTEDTNYFWGVFIAFLVCLIGSASIGFPIPFPFILFTLSNSLLMKYGNQGLLFQEILANSNFWMEIMGFVVFGGLGCAIGELAGYIAGYGAGKLIDTSSSKIMKNLSGFGKLVLENEKRTPLYIFLFALTPAPDDLLYIPLGLLKYKWYKALIPGWIGKTFTTLFYCLWPVLVRLGLLGIGAELTTIQDVIIEGIMLILTLTIMMFIFGFDWSRYLEDRQKKEK